MKEMDAAIASKIRVAEIESKLDDIREEQEEIRVCIVLCV